tara:strand:+ start:1144 stop:1329 length:186 start_codon:yes stop_codon:yes gene_type:complete
MKILKEVAKIKDRLTISGGKRSKVPGGISMENGGSVPVDLIAKAFGVSVEKAQEIKSRLCR